MATLRSHFRELRKSAEIYSEIAHLKIQSGATHFNLRNWPYRIILFRPVPRGFIRAKTRFDYLYGFWGIWADGRVAISLAEHLVSPIISDVFLRIAHTSIRAQCPSYC